MLLFPPFNMPTIKIKSIVSFFDPYFIVKINRMSSCGLPIFLYSHSLLHYVFVNPAQYGHICHSNKKSYGNFEKHDYDRIFLYFNCKYNYEGLKVSHLIYEVLIY